MIDTTFLITAFVTMFVVIDPIGLAPLFVTLTQGKSASARQKIAARSCLVSIGLLTVFAILGDSVLEFIGISMSAFRISGGILLFILALDMLFERRSQRREDKAEDDENGDDPSVFPLAIPMIAGPGSIATIILLVGQKPGATGLIMVLGVTVAVIALVMLLFLASSMIERALGKTGITVVTRLLGMLLAALSIQFVLDGLRDFGLAVAAG
jgi:multiple antibiotic resistance protein